MNIFKTSPSPASNSLAHSGHSQDNLQQIDSSLEVNFVKPTPTLPSLRARILQQVVTESYREDEFLINRVLNDPINRAEGIC